MQRRQVEDIIRNALSGACVSVEPALILRAGIDRAAEVERNYLRCTSSRGKAKHAQAVWDTSDGEQDFNFGITLNLMSGRL